MGVARFDSSLHAAHHLLDALTGVLSLLQIKDDGTTLEAANGDVIPDVDIIVFATGFDIKAPLSQFDIRARGAELTQTLTDRPGAYYGLAMAGFPNLFTLLGLNTGEREIGGLLSG